MPQPLDARAESGIVEELRGPELLDEHLSSINDILIDEAHVSALASYPYLIAASARVQGFKYRISEAYNLTDVWIDE